MQPQFASTQWSVVLAAKQGGSETARAALEALCATYWRPLYAFARRSGHSIEDAQDVTQSFFMRFIEKDSLRHVDPKHGKFRAFLLTSLRNFLANEWRRGQAWKRGGTMQLIGLDELTRAESACAASHLPCESPERAYERSWAMALLDRTTARLAAEFAVAGKARIFDELKPYLAGDRQTPYSAPAAALGMNDVAVRVAVHRMRGRFRDLLIDEVSRTLPAPVDPSALEEELQYLLGVL